MRPATPLTRALGRSRRFMQWAQACEYFNQWAWLRLKTGKFGKRGEVLPETKKARKRT